MNIAERGYKKIKLYLSRMAIALSTFVLIIVIGNEVIQVKDKVLEMVEEMEAQKQSLIKDRNRNWFDKLGGIDEDKH